MTNMEYSQPYDLDPRQAAEALVAQYDQVLERGVQIGYPERSGENAIDVFPQPTTPRADAPRPQWDMAQETDMRAVAAELGYGRESDRTMSELNLGSAHALYEGGKPAKYAAEVAVVFNDAAATPSSHIFLSNPYREIGADEREDVAKLYKKSDIRTEYDVARLTAESMPGFTPNDQDEILPLSYDIQNQHAVGQEPTGQFISIGHIDEAPVVLFKVDREVFVGDEGKQAYRNQPNTCDVARIISKTLELGGDTVTPMAFVTSATYQASREIDVVRASLATNRTIGVPTYGTVRLAEVKGEQTPAPAAINQLPGELHRAAENVVKLKAELANA